MEQKPSHRRTATVDIPKRQHLRLEIWRLATALTLRYERHRLAGDDHIQPWLLLTMPLVIRPNLLSNWKAACPYSVNTAYLFVPASVSSTTAFVTEDVRVEQKQIVASTNKRNQISYFLYSFIITKV